MRWGWVSDWTRRRGKGRQWEKGRTKRKGKISRERSTGRRGEGRGERKARQGREMVEKMASCETTGGARAGPRTRWGRITEGRAWVKREGEGTESQQRFDKPGAAQTGRRAGRSLKAVPGDDLLQGHDPGQRFGAGPVTLTMGSSEVPGPGTLTAKRTGRSSVFGTSLCLVKTAASSCESALSPAQSTGKREGGRVPARWHALSLELCMKIE